MIRRGDDDYVLKHLLQPVAEKNAWYGLSDPRKKLISPKKPIFKEFNILGANVTQFFGALSFLPT
jgi:hypothetical protein